MLSAELGLPQEEQIEVMIAGALHDIGALSLRERLDTLNFEVEHPHEHGEAGYLLLRTFEPFSKVATLVRHHHTAWEDGKGSIFGEHLVPMGSHLLHLADRVDVLTSKKEEVLGEAKSICERIAMESGRLFRPDLVRAFLNSAKKESFWLDIVFPSIGEVLARKTRAATIELDLGGLLGMAKLFSQIIDFRSRFTAVHSCGVAATAEVIGGYCGFSEEECQMMRVAGYLHDLGKLAVPSEILESPNRLGEDEFRIIKSHTFFTCRILETIRDLDVITSWASFHHERLGGKGYPFHYRDRELPLGSRIMSVADVFTALTEDRPYRRGLNPEEAMAIVNEMAEASTLDSSVVSVLRDHQDEINAIRGVAQGVAQSEYEQYSRARSNFAERCGGRA
jgi:HD-GYP domain-containing protein (c-di-GMP phosphodiesterase class II)